MRKTIEQDKYISGDSENWANWQANLDLNFCEHCEDQHGRIIDRAILGNNRSISAHSHCRCVYVPMRTKEVGTATDKGLLGADIYLMYLGYLPSNYVSKEQAKLHGWKRRKGNLSEVLPGMAIGGNFYINDDRKLPHKSGRKWREADINYTGGHRNRQRLVYSNDGLIFATYDHFHTFYEITE